MKPTVRTRLATIAVAVAVFGGSSAAIIWLAFGDGLPSGPVPIVWDREPCAHCRMHIGEPAFAAQLQTRDGRVLNYDDPGCLVQHVAATTPKVHAIYFRHFREARWIAHAQVAFVATTPTPMGFGHGAVGAPDGAAVSFEAFRNHVLTSRMK